MNSDPVPRDVGRLGLGTAAFVPGYGLGAEVPTGRALIRAAVKAGISYIDTAAGYEGVEELLGTCADFLDAQAIRVCVKLQAVAMEEGLQGSLRRLGCRRVDTLLVHSASVEELQDPRVATWMDEAKRKGTVVFTGASTYGVEAAMLALEQSWCNVVQVEHNILNPSVVRAVASRKQSWQRLVVRSIFCKGLLTSRRVLATHLPEGTLARLNRLEEIAREWGMSLPELASRFALDTPGVDLALVGVSQLAELEMVLASVRRRPLEPRQIELLRAFDVSSESWVHPKRWPVAA